MSFYLVSKPGWTSADTELNIVTCFSDMESWFYNCKFAHVFVVQIAYCECKKGAKQEVNNPTTNHYEIHGQ